MYKFYFRACLFITLLIFPFVIYAAGLGKLTLNSALGQPLKAEIDLVAVRNDESSSLIASLASQEAFRQAGINYEPFLSTLEIAIDARSNGDPYIRITSPNSINEPFLNVLVELSWASGRLMREYTVLLDPVESATPEPIAPAIVGVPVVAETYSDEPEVQGEPVIEQVQAEPAVVSESFSGDTYGPVSQGDTLSKIAQQISPHSANLNQIMIALFRANQSAFIGNNINLIKVGEILHIPSINEIEEISVMEANAEVKVHVADWRNYKNELAGVSNEAPADESLKQVDSGEIITAVEDEIVALEAQPEEVLRLSGGVHTEDMLESDEDESDMSQERIRMIEEDSIARSLALIEANERIELLEKNIRNLQQLLELKDPALAQAQIQAENAYEETSNMHEEISVDDLVPESIDDILPALENIIDTSEQKLDELLSSDAELEESIAALDFAEESDNAPVDVTNELPVEAPVEASIMDQLMDNIAYVGGLLTFMLLSALIAIKIRRKKAEKEAEEDELNFDSSSSLRNRVASVAAADALAAHEESGISQANEDSLAPEAEVQSETEANFDTPDVKNSKEDSEEIDLDFSLEDTFDEGIAEPASPLDEAEDISQSILEPELESGADIDLDLDHLDENIVQSDDQEQSIELADELIKNNADDLAVDSLTSDTTGTDEELAFTDEAIASLEEAIQNERQAAAETSAPELPETDTEEGEAAQQENEMDLEFNLDSENLTDGETSPAVTEEVGGEAESPRADNSISFDLDTPTEPAENLSLDQGVPQETEIQSQEEKSDLSIDFPEASDTPEVIQDPSDEVTADATLDLAATPTETTAPGESATAAEPEEHDENWHDVETKIDLAKAYIEMDDGEGAKEILEEVAKDGDAGQQDKAKSMLEGLS